MFGQVILDEIKALNTKFSVVENKLDITTKMIENLGEIVSNTSQSISILSKEMTTLSKMNEIKLNMFRDDVNLMYNIMKSQLDEIYDQVKTIEDVQKNL